MELLIESYKNTGDLHHAYILEGEATSVREKLFEFIAKNLKIEIKGNPDFWFEHYDSLAIDDARKLREAQANKAMGGGKKIFIIETRAITIEAQNALLKFLEEPTADTYIFIIIPSTELILPTLRSRTITISFKGKSHKSQEAKDFISYTLSERIKKVGEISEEKGKTQAMSLLDGLISEFHGKPKKEALLEELLMCRMYVNDRSSSLKLLLEHIACILP